MDIRQLEAFVYTVKYQSFSLAAQKLYLSQPTVSSLPSPSLTNRSLHSLKMQSTAMIKQWHNKPLRNSM